MSDYGTGLVPDLQRKVDQLEGDLCKAVLEIEKLKALVVPNEASPDPYAGLPDGSKWLAITNINAFIALDKIYDEWKRKLFPDWEADWGNGVQEKYCPIIDGEILICFELYRSRRHFPFPSQDHCRKFKSLPAIAKLLKTFYGV